IDKSVEKEMGQITKLNKKSNQKLKEQLGVYLAAEKETDAARASMNAAAKRALAATHHFNAAVAKEEATKDTQEADKKQAEIKRISDERAEMVKSVTTVLGVVTSVVGFIAAPTPMGAFNLAMSLGGKLVEALGSADDGTIAQLSSELAKLRQMAADKTLTAANEEA